MKTEKNFARPSRGLMFKGKSDNQNYDQKGQ